MVAEGIEERLVGIRERLARACGRVGRDPAGVRLVAVSKTVGPDQVAAAVAAGLRVFGESRVQEAAQKIPLCPGRLEWHFIGHLQTNKAAAAVAAGFRLIHSVDSIRLLQALQEAAEQAGVRLPVLLEVNVSGEACKFGFAPEAVVPVLEGGAAWSCLEVCGLMTVPPLTADPEDARPFFAKLAARRDEWQARVGVALPELSMGMSHDFEVAVECGATWIRVGTALFGARKG